MILSHVSSSGKLNFFCDGNLVELLVDALRQFTADPLDAGEVVDARRDDTLQSAAMLEQLLARGPTRVSR